MCWITLRRVPSSPAAKWPSGSAPEVAKPCWTMIGAAARRAAAQMPDQRRVSASASASGVSVNGLTPSAWWSGARISASSPPA